MSGKIVAADVYETASGKLYTLGLTKRTVRWAVFQIDTEGRDVKRLRSPHLPSTPTVAQAETDFWAYVNGIVFFGSKRARTEWSPVWEKLRNDRSTRNEQG